VIPPILPVVLTIPTIPEPVYPLTPILSFDIKQQCADEVKNVDDPRLIAYYPSLGLADQHKSDRKVTRAEFIMLLLKAAKVDVKSTVEHPMIENPYTDLPKYSITNKYILRATELGLITGKNGIIRPKDIISRGEIAKILVRAADI